MKRILKKTLTPLLALTMALGIGFSITNNREIMKALRLLKHIHIPLVMVLG